MKMSNKAQESMPIQLLLGVTILTFVVTIGLFSYRQACAAQYDHRVSAGLNRIKGVIEQAYQGGVGTTPPPVVLDTTVPPGCGIGFDSVRLIDGPEAQCEANIGKEDCVMAVAVAVDEDGNRYVSSRTFIDVPEGVTIDMAGLDDRCRNNNYPSILDEEPGDDVEPGDDYCGWGTGKFTVKATRDERDTILIEDLRED